MSFIVLFLCGVAGGALGGMGMGGGAALIPLLTLACGVPQTAAQGVNLLSFLPMATAALAVHAKNGLVRREGVAFLVLPALLFSALFSLLAVALPAAALKKGFGVFLVVLSFFELRGALAQTKEKSRARSAPEKRPK